MKKREKLKQKKGPELENIEKEGTRKSVTLPKKALNEESRKDIFEKKTNEKARDDI